MANNTGAVNAGTAAAGIAGAALGGPAMWTMLALQFLPYLLASKQEDPREKYKKWLEGQLSEENVAARTREAFGGVIASPAYQAALSQIAQGANQTQSDTAAALAARGLGTSGMGAILGSLTPSLVGSQQAGLYTKGYELARKEAMDRINSLIQGLPMSSMTGPSPREAAFAAGLNAIAGPLTQYVNQRWPGTPKTKAIGTGSQAPRLGSDMTDTYGTLGTQRDLTGSELFAPGRVRY